MNQYQTGFDLARKPRIPTKWYTKLLLVLVAVTEVAVSIFVLPRMSKTGGFVLVIFSALVFVYLMKVVLLSFMTKKVKNV